MARTSPLRAGGLLAFLLLAHPGAARATAVGPFVQQGARLIGADANPGAVFGISSALSNDGDIAVFGASTDNGNGGAAFVFTRTNGAWSQLGPKLIGAGAVGNASQGDAVAISGDGSTIAVGGSLDDGGKGAVWIFTRSGDGWEPQGSKLVATGAAGNANQGFSLALSDDGNTLAVGGHRDNGNVGATWIYTRSGSTWTQQGGKLTGSDAAGAARQGASVALSADGNTLLTSGPGDHTNAGAAWVFVRSAGTWSQQGPRLVGSDAATNAAQGVSVALARDGRTAMIGGTSDAGGLGAAWIFRKDGSAWTQQGPKLVPPGATANANVGSGCALSSDGDLAAIGGHGVNSSEGTVWIYSRSGGAWTPLQPRLVGTGGTATAHQGWAVRLSADGNTLVSTGPFDTGLNGAAWVFTNPLVESCQFASSVGGYSSQFSPNEWSAQQALGEPDLYPGYCDCGTAWAPASPDDQQEYLHLAFATAKRINFVNVYETFSPGAVSSIDVRNPATGGFERVWTGTAEAAPGAARLFTATFPVTPYEVSEVRINLDSPAVPDYNEIDAVSIGYKDLAASSQWASGVHAVSSQYSPTAWAAQQAVGPPDVYPQYGDIDRAWASLNPDDQPEVLELLYSTPAPISYVSVYETFNPGALNHVSVKNPNTGLYETVWSGVAAPQPGISRIHTVSFPETRYPVDQLRLGFDSPAVPDWNEVDAVGIGRCACTTSWVGAPSAAVAPKSGAIEWAQPNPFVASTALAFTLARPGRVKVEIYDVLGQRVTRLVDRLLPAGRNQALWDGRGADGRTVASGIYYVRVQSAELNGTRKVVKLE